MRWGADHSFCMALQIPSAFRMIGLARRARAAAMASGALHSFCAASKGPSAYPGRALCSDALITALWVMMLGVSQVLCMASKMAWKGPERSPRQSALLGRAEL